MKKTTQDSHSDLIFNEDNNFKKIVFFLI